MVEIAFAADIVIGFITSVLTPKGVISFDSSDIYKNYTS